MAFNQFIVSPFALDAPLPAAPRFAPRDAVLNAPHLSGPTQQALVSQIHAPLAAFVAQTVRRGGRPVSIAGDCCATIGVLAGLQRAGLDPIVVWLDAHGDFNTWETTPSGFMGGMPLAMVVGRGDQALAEAVGLRLAREEDVLLADARDLDPGERVALEASAVRRVGDVGGIEALLPPGRPLYVHLDPDVINPGDAPAMLYPAAGGPSLDRVRAACSALAGTGRVAAASLTLWQVEKDTDGRTERACLSALRALIG